MGLATQVPGTNGLHYASGASGGTATASRLTAGRRAIHWRPWGGSGSPAPLEGGGQPGDRPRRRLQQHRWCAAVPPAGTPLPAAAAARVPAPVAPAGFVALWRAGAPSYRKGRTNRKGGVVVREPDLLELLAGRTDPTWWSRCSTRPLTSAGARSAVGRAARCGLPAAAGQPRPCVRVSERPAFLHSFQHACCRLLQRRWSGGLAYASIHHRASQERRCGCAPFKG